jgi:hypothetical protein
MKEQSKTAYLKPVCRIGPDTAEGFQRTATQRISSWPGDSISTNRPNTLTQTFFFVYTLFPCTQTADHTFGNFKLHDWSYVQSHGTLSRIQVLKSSPKAHHFQQLTAA